MLLGKGYTYTLSEAWSGVNWADLMAAQGAFGTAIFMTGLYSVQSINQSIIVLAIKNIAIYRLCQTNNEQYQNNRFDPKHT